MDFCAWCVRPRARSHTKNSSVRAHVVTTTYDTVKCYNEELGEWTPKQIHCNIGWVLLFKRPKWCDIICGTFSLFPFIRLIPCLAGVCVCVSWLGLVTIPFRMSSDVLVLEHLFACGRGCGCAFRRGCLSPATHLNRHNGKRQLSPVGSCAWSFAALNNRIFVLLLIAYGAAAIGGWNVKQNEKNEIPGNVWSSL